MNMPFKTTPAPVAKERSRTVYTNTNSFKTTPAPGAKQRSRTAYTRNIPFKRHRLPERNNGPRPFTSGCLVQNGIGSRSQTVPDRLYNKYLVQKTTPAPGAEQSQTVTQRKKISRSKPHQAPGTNKRSRTVHKWIFIQTKHRLPEPNGPGPFTQIKYLVQNNTGSQSRTVPDRYTKAFVRDENKTL